MSGGGGGGFGGLETYMSSDAEPPPFLPVLRIEATPVVPRVFVAIIFRILRREDLE